MHPARSAAFVVASQVLKLLISLISLVTLSRLLQPTDFGLFAMIAAIIGIGELFRDFGLSMAAIQTRTLSPAQQANLFWLNLTIGVGLAAIFVALAHPIAVLYGQPSTAPAVMIAPIAFVFNGAAAQYRVGLIRRDRFSALTVADVGSLAAALTVAVVLALLGAGLWALVAQSLVQAAVALVLVAVQLRWLPGLPNRRGSLKSMIGFGSNFLGTQVLTYLGKNLDNVLLGRVWGPTALGYYSKAFTLYGMPQQIALAPFTDLALRTLATSSEDPELYGRRVRSMQMIANYVALSMFAALIALAGPVVAIVLGPGWGQTALLLQILSIGGSFQLLGYVYYWIFLSEALTRIHLRCVLISQPLAIACLVAGLPFGVVGVAWGATVGLFIEWLVPATWGVSRTSLAGGPLLKNVVRPLLFCAGFGVAVHVASLLVSDSPAPIEVVVGLLGGCVWSGACILVWSGVRRDLRLVAAFGASVVRRRPVTATSP